MLSTGFWNMLKLGFIIRPIFFYLYGVSIGLFVWKIIQFKAVRTIFSGGEVYELYKRLNRFVVIFIIMACISLIYRIGWITFSVHLLNTVYEITQGGLTASGLINGVIEYSSDGMVAIIYSIVNLCFYCILVTWRDRIVFKFFKSKDV